MLRRSFLQSLPFAAPPVRPAPPNIVYILADDLGWGDLGCYNPASKIPTPNLDRLAGQGMRFTDMHSPSAVCTPTRYGVLTGRYCWRSSLKKGVLNGYSPNLIEHGRPTVASLLKSRGYTTAAFGKWHLGLGTQPNADFSAALRPCPTDHGFDTFYGIPASLDMPPYAWIENDRAVKLPTAETPGDPGYGGGRGRFYRGGATAPGFEVEDVLPTIVDRAERFLKAQTPAKPFFLYLPFTAPHTPWAPLAAYNGRSKAGLYGDFVTQVDAAVGSIIQTLDQSRLAANTLVCFTSDNGAYWHQIDIDQTGHRANAGWRGMKADIYEGGHRIPFLARWPGHIQAGATSAQLGCLTDLAATSAELAAISLPRDAAEDSFSLAPALLGTKPATPVRDAIVNHSMSGIFGIRRGPWKLALGRGSGGFTKPATIEVAPGEPLGELYHLGDDPGETNNLWATQPGMVASLTELLENYKSRGRSRPAFGR